MRDSDEVATRRRPVQPLVAAQLDNLSLSELEQLLEEEKSCNDGLPSGAELTAFFESLSTEELEAYTIALAQRLRAETEVLTWFESEGLDPLALDLAQLDLPFPVQLVPTAGTDLIPVHRDGRAWYRGGTR